MREGKITRSTKETEISVGVNLDGSGRAEIATGIGFLDHMLDLLARHSRIDLAVKAKGDLHIDQHHTTEDVGIVLGQAIKKALGDMRGITRYADVQVPMDETLTRVAIDISGRPVLVFRVEFPRDKIGEFDVDLDLHLDVGDSPEGMLIHQVIELTERYGRGGRVVAGHEIAMMRAAIFLCKSHPHARVMLKLRPLVRINRVA